MSALKMMHVARRDLGLDEDDYRAVLERVTGKRSAAVMTNGERQACVDEFKRLGFAATQKASRTRLDGPYAGKLRALWLSAWHLGIARDRRDSALTAFVERQTGIASTRWLRNAYDAQAAIEGLKAWIAREGGVEWPATGGPKAQKLAVIDAQMQKLGSGDVAALAATSATGLDAIIADLGAQIRAAA
ncbi:MAG: regulatory protein GemA [Thermomonas sp.]|uniref:regulatory protein GemA n=1 Tax=Thermomonas sp. TaxID=1971895 RepID=UPI00262DA6F6|nr:regulatory protein GemA [Thermomonas sp.]MCC7097293.1 regulatory protein GemA [Thermomonas sp.]